MSRTICIFGNSHISAPAMSDQNALFREKGDEIRYWGLAGSSFPAFRYEGGTVVSPFPASSLAISDWCEHLAVAPIDVLVCYGFHISPSTQARTMARALRQTRGMSSEMYRAFTAEMLEKWWREQSGRVLMEGIKRDFPEKRVIFYPQPNIAEGSSFFKAAGNDDQVKASLADILAFLEARVTALGVEYRPQPAETVVQEIFTAARFNGGSTKWGTNGEEHETEDDRHMNALYGDVILQDLAGAVYR